MSDKRFEKWNDYSCKVKDNQENTLLDWEDVVKKLNEQQDTINDLNGELEESSAFIIEQRKEIQTLKEENEQLRNKLEVANARSSYYQRMLEKWCVWENQVQLE